MVLTPVSKPIQCIHKKIFLTFFFFFEEKVEIFFLKSYNFFLKKRNNNNFEFFFCKILLACLLCILNNSLLTSGYVSFKLLLSRVYSNYQCYKINIVARRQDIIRITEQLIESINMGDFETYT